MGLLSIDARQQYLKSLGFYSGIIDGIEGNKTKQAYLELQKKYFTNEKDCDGKYGQNTETLLKSVYNFQSSTFFKLEEFKCKCGTKYCTGYPSVIDINLITNLNKLRKQVNSPLTIKSGLRCTKWNKLQGGATSSRHMTGKAADISGLSTNSGVKRKSIKDSWMKLPKARYTYCQEDSTKYKMGNSVHVDVL